MKWLILLLVSVNICQFGNAQKWNKFRNDTISFTAQYPEKWVNSVREGGVVFFTSPAENDNDAFYENINIRMSENPAFGVEVQIKETLPAVLEKLTTLLDDFKVTTQRFFKWNGEDACEIIYTGKTKEEAMEVKITQWLGFSKGRLFTATYTSLESNTIYLKDSRKILKSIKF